ncbi:MAG TPA: type 1 glutamine amidotransferase domain-containing protein [Candidatus Binatia bacterium]
MAKLDGKKIAILATDGFEQSELTEPKKALEDAGAETFVISLKSGEIKGWKHTDWGDKVPVDLTVDEANPDDFDALVLPGGVMNPDRLRWNDRAVDFVKSIYQEAKPIAAICHGPWTLIEAGVARNRRMTSWPSLKTDLKNAGADWVDEEVVVDRGVITSRKPDDIPAFNKKMIELFAASRARNEQAAAQQVS